MFQQKLLCEGLQKGGNKSGVHALRFEPVNQEQFEVFHEVDALYNKKGGLESRSSKGHLTSGPYARSRALQLFGDPYLDQ